MNRICDTSGVAPAPMTENDIRRIEHVGEAVRIQHYAVTRFDLCIKRCVGTHGIRQRAQNHASGREQARLGPRLNNHRWPVSGSSALHCPAAAVNLGRRQREEKPRHANILNHKRV